MKANELPEGWSELKLGELIDGIEAGLSFKCIEQPPQGDAPGLVKISAVTWGRFQETESKTIPNGIPPAENLRIRPGDLLISRANTIELVGACVLVENVSKQLFLSDKVLRIKISCENKRWLLYFLRSPSGRRQIELASSGNQLSMRNLSQDGLRSVKVPVPPLAEQKRIAEKLEAVLGRVDACRTRLDRVPALLKRFRQSVLAAATSGQLTEDWRGGNNETPDSVEDFLGHLAVLRHEKWKQTPKAASGRRYVEPDEMDSSDLPSIPDSWRWASVDAVSSQVTDGEHIQPPYQDVGLPMLSAKHVRDGFVDPESAGLIAEDAFYKALERCAPKNGDILIVSVGATTGRVAIVENCAPFAIVRSVLLVKPLISNRYLLRCLQSSWCYQRMTKASGASAQAHLYIKDTKRLPVPIPPLPEQTEIVRRVEALFAMADRIEARLSSAQKTVERLTPAVLAQAFRGQLVPQDPTDEPAEALLARLAAQNQPTSRSAKKSKK